MNTPDDTTDANRAVVAEPEAAAQSQQRRGGRLPNIPRPRLRRGDGGERSPIDEVLKKVRSYNPKADTREIARAYAFAETAHEGQKRKSGEDFITHPVAVTSILADLRLDTTTLEAALLHDTVEDTPTTVEEIEEGFGPEVSRIVDGLTKLEKFDLHSREQEQAENVRKMMVAMAGDIRVLLIKLADRLHNMRTLGIFPEAKQRRIATETLEIYAPLAHRLGVQEIKWELEDLSFKTLHPGPYREIASLVAARRGERQALIEQVTTEARAKLKELGVKAEVEGRPKHLYSIYEKMVIRGKEFNEIYDLVGVRILVDSMRDCYGALGAVHSLWKPIPGRFKDYVAMPKSNMYQSLHTTVVGPGGKPLEIQIRTRDMHRTAKFGIAAHWRYKEGSKQAKAASAEAAWLGQMMDWLKDMADPREFMDSLRIDLYGGQVFVFTPKGDVVNLPAGATPVDFAYAIHTDVGHRTIGAKVGGKLVPLDYELRTGDTVEILASRAQGEGPSQDWLQFVKTTRARSKIRQWFSRGRREDALEQGREAVTRMMRKQNLPIKRLATTESLGTVAEELKYPNLEALYIAVGEGHVSPQSIVARVSRLVGGDTDEDVAEVPLARPVRLGGRDDVSKGVVVRGLPDVWVRLSRCCTPVPGDEILGFVTKGQGVSVHRTDCPNVTSLRQQPERLIDVTWAEGKSTSFVVAIQVEALDRTRLLSDVATVLSDGHVNILSATSTTGKDRITRLRFTFELADIAHLSSVLASVKRVESVYDAYRVVPS
ncbi:MAG: bifunctional (p)ppGpp synthetase/guanosine-3',5'-bis(diphosphate) 3'-pyrophosphohydrolase [Actinomycetota bacterium]|nr:bifunctional (p)ppGpp synthetase/guanosine-3',5'-bis(diphosphate) 3'-pyrophosphohydrolase [Actinomycetota bacterium]MDH5223633.1 bifunctional (p)ppGpp synthetase/guanosine-3',5'-bis(diphosphate) 3'-pyrophosphohydrolase [Actinomycetota bacterium]MDH5313261.1 bifunctional (p)ppGpp synthetase/guanosine-3',5'-bis(diphosphate) 3'-pyrophosphohydrolase [Actinomycetota bacterium]